jgi:hypothetical protein
VGVVAKQQLQINMSAKRKQAHCAEAQGKRPLDMLREILDRVSHPEKSFFFS